MPSLPSDSSSGATRAARAMQLCVGPLQYWWPRQTLMAFYADIAEGPADTVVLGEVCCSRRHEFTLDDWLALGRELTQAGKRVRLATLPLLMSEAELRQMRRIAAEQTEFELEAGDTAALQAHASRPDGTPRPALALGPHINIYNRSALQEHALPGCVTWVPPLELALDAVARINPPRDPVRAPEGGALRTELFAFGRMPLAFSARCFTARHHHLPKDQCDFRCRDDADGLLLKSREGQDFLVLNGIQTQSAGLHCVLGEPDAIAAAGIAALRLSPCSGDFHAMLVLHEQVFNGRLPAAEALRQAAGLNLPGTLVHGFARREAGMKELEHA